MPPEQPASAYRSPGPVLQLAGILCLKHCRKVARDNTVKYNWHTLQLLPSMERPSYAGVQVEVQERSDGRSSYAIKTAPHLPRRRRYALVFCVPGMVIGMATSPHGTITLVVSKRTSMQRWERAPSTSRSRLGRHSQKTQESSRQPDPAA